jgi:hypothetical protein
MKKQVEKKIQQDAVIALRLRHGRLRFPYRRWRSRHFHIPAADHSPIMLNCDATLFLSLFFIFLSDEALIVFAMRMVVKTGVFSSSPLFRSGPAWRVDGV